MPRIAFRLRIKADAVEKYEEAHAAVWPELLAKLKEVGISDYSIFRRGQDLFLVMQVKDFDAPGLRWIRTPSTSTGKRKWRSISSAYLTWARRNDSR